MAWSKRLKAINNILLDILNVDALWLLTINPLPPTGCGMVRTPLTVAPNAQVELADTAPPLTDDWPPPDSLLAEVIANRQPYFISATNRQEIPTDFDLGGVLFETFLVDLSAIVPLMSNDVPVGMLVIASHDVTQNPLSDETQALLQHLSGHLGLSLKNAHLVDRSRRHTGALRTLNEIARTITSSLDIEDVLHRTMAGINEILDVEAGSLLLVDEETNELYFKLTLRGENKQITNFRLQWGQGIAGWVVAQNEPLIVNNVRTDKRFYAKIDEAIGFITNTILGVPLVVHGEPIGALEVINKRSDLFNKDDRELLVSMAASLGIALENADLYTKAREKSRQISFINEVAAAINIGHGLTETGRIIYEQFRRIIPFHHISISIFDDSRENVRQWVFNEYGAQEQTKWTIPFHNSALAEILRKEAGHIQPDISTAKKHLDNQVMIEEGIHTKMALPLTTAKGTFGCLNIGHHQPAAYSREDISRLQPFIPQVAVAVERANLIDITEKRASRLQMLNHLGEMLVSITDFELIVDTTLSMLPRLLPGDVQGIIISDEENAYLGVAVPFDFAQTDEIIEEILDQFRQIREEGVSTHLAYSKSIAGNLPVSADWEPVSVLSMPILTQLGSLGIIYLASGRREDMSDEVVRIFSLIVSQISAVIENARLFHQIEQERARLTAILDSSTDAVLAVNRDGRIVLDNPAAWTVMGVEESQKGHLLRQNTNNKELIGLFEQAIAQETKVTGEIILENNRTFYANLSPVSTEEDGIIGWVATMQDVSHFKELDEMKSEFVSAVSHDLRSPLSGILIAANMLPQVGPVTEPQQEMLDTIQRRVERMKRLIDDLLDVGKIEAGIDMEMESCFLSPTIEDVSSALRPQAYDKSIDLISKVEENLPPIRGNSTRLYQVINNLVSNAIKYTPEGGRVTIKAFQRDGEIQVEVIDTGLGIPAKDQPHIFEKFYRVKGKHVDSIKGTGLGLAITKSIIEKHQGRIWLESAFGKGSTFAFTLPIPNATDQ